MSAAVSHTKILSALSGMHPPPGVFSDLCQQKSWLEFHVWSSIGDRAPRLLLASPQLSRHPSSHLACTPAAALSGGRQNLLQVGLCPGPNNFWYPNTYETDEVLTTFPLKSVSHHLKIASGVETFSFNPNPLSFFFCCYLSYEIRKLAFGCCVPGSFQPRN